MPNYFFTAKSQAGESHSGTQEAKDELDLARILRQEGYVLISAVPEEEKKEKFRFSLPFFGGVSLKDKIMLTRNLKVMIAAGLSLPKALKTLLQQSENTKLKKALLEIIEEVIKGENFSDSLAKYPDIFSPLFCSMVRVGEESGTLEKNLVILTNQMEREYELKTKIKGALMYPAVIIAAMIGIGVMMLIMVVPKLAETFKELGVELPLTTRIVIGLGTFLAEKWYLVILIFVFLIFLFQIMIKKKTVRRMIDAIALKLPVISPLIKKTNAAYTVRTLSSLIDAGVPLVRSLEIISETLDNLFFKKAIVQALEEVKKGEKLSSALKPYQNLYPLTVVQMIEVGEETGETSNVLGKLSEFYEEEITNATQNLAAVIEPLLMLIVGGAVGFFAISMVQPMYSMLQGLQ